MADKGKSVSADSTATALLKGLGSFRIHKPNQGRLVRQATFAGLVLLAGFGCFSLSNELLGEYDQNTRRYVPLAIWAAIAWVSFRVVNLPRFVDFLAAVDSEREKVVWPDKPQVLRSTVVVITTMVLMGVFLFLVDMFWRFLFSVINFIEYTPG